MRKHVILPVLAAFTAVSVPMGRGGAAVPPDEQRQTDEKVGSESPPPPQQPAESPPATADTSPPAASQPSSETPAESVREEGGAGGDRSSSAGTARADRTDRRHEGHAGRGGDARRHRDHDAHRRRHRHGGYSGPQTEDYVEVAASEPPAANIRPTYAIGTRFDPRSCPHGFEGFLGRLFPERRAYCRPVDAARYHLPAPPPGHSWLRFYKDALLLESSTGEVRDVIRDFF